MIGSPQPVQTAAGTITVKVSVMVVMVTMVSVPIAPPCVSIINIPIGINRGSKGYPYRITPVNNSGVSVIGIPKTVVVSLVITPSKGQGPAQKN
jgi:hypothetical protein